MGERRVIDVTERLFHFEVRPFTRQEVSTTWVGNEVFLYLLQPPLLDFQYSLVSVDSSLKVIEVMKVFDNSLPWSTTTVRGDLKGLAIQLRVKELDGGESFFLKKL